MAAGLPLLGLALTAGAAGLQYASANAMNQQYQKAQNDWVAYQRKQKLDFMKSEEANRRLAALARNKGLNKLGDMKDTVGDETARLTEAFGGEGPPPDAPQADVANLLLSGQQGDEGFKTYLAKTINQTAKTTRNETAALAAMQAYTGGQFGLNNTTAQTLQDTSQWIDFYNQRRKGDQNVLRTAQAVPMKQVQASAGAGIGPAMASIGGSMMGGSNPFSGLSNMF